MQYTKLQAQALLDGGHVSGKPLLRLSARLSHMPLMLVVVIDEGEAGKMALAASMKPGYVMLRLKVSGHD